MAPSFRDGHFVGDGDNWVPLWAKITPLPEEEGTPPENPYDRGDSDGSSTASGSDSRATSANLIVYINQGLSGSVTQVHIGSQGDGRSYLGSEYGQAIVVIPLSPGDPEPEILSPADVPIDFRLEIV